MTKKQFHHVAVVSFSLLLGPYVISETQETQEASFTRLRPVRMRVSMCQVASGQSGWCKFLRVAEWLS